MSSSTTPLETSSTIPYGTLVKTEGEKAVPYPKHVLFIIVNEVCERFSFYGLRTVLTLYLRNILLYDENESTVWYHLFTMLCYFTPLFGAVLADSYLGKFKTILYLSILYGCGNILMSVASIPNTLPQRGFSLLALFIIALGTGGIKPCVSAFGGDQFVRPQQDKELVRFFSIFYMAVNIGSLFSTYVSPILRENVHCFGQNSCFPLAFGVPAILMVISIAVFLFGKRNYKMNQPEGNIMWQVLRCSTYAIKRKIRAGSDEKHSHWLDFATDKFDKHLIEDIKQALRVLLLLLPMPMFWALFDQQGSRWTFQATRMDRTLGASFSIKPDQLQIINPLLIILLVPVFGYAIYPCLEKCKLLTPLRKMGAGGVLTGLAFVISGIVELQIEPTYPRIPAKGFTQLNFINSLPCHVNLSYTNNNFTKWIELDATSYSMERDLKDEPMQVKAHLAAPLCGDKNFTSTQWTGFISGHSSKAFTVVITEYSGNLQVIRLQREAPLEKSVTGNSRLTFIVDKKKPAFDEQTRVQIKGDKSGFKFSLSKVDAFLPLISSDVEDIFPGTYQVYLLYGEESSNKTLLVGNVTIFSGGCYTVFINEGKQMNDSKGNSIMALELTPASSVHMLWLIPQYVVITVAEILVSITGLDLAYTQAPSSMKSLMQACWLLTVAFGNVIVVLVAEAKAISRQSMEFFLFAGLMILDMLVFFYLAMRYTYVVTENENKENKEVEEENKSLEISTDKLPKGIENMTFDTRSTQF